MSSPAWYTLGEVAAVLHVSRLTAWRLVRPYRDRCHLARAGRHPRLCLWVPLAVVEDLQASRSQWWKTRGAELVELLAKPPVKPFSP